MEKLFSCRFVLMIMVSFLMLVVEREVTPVNGESQIDALTRLRMSFIDPNDVLHSWDPTLPDPCTWLHITCDKDSQVTGVQLAYTGISGTLAPEIGRLSNLKNLELFNNSLEGILPSELGNLANLVNLDLYSNKFTGSLPQSLKNLTSLVSLRVNDNNFCGGIPMELTGLPNLESADFSNNELCGPRPTGGSFAKLPPKSFSNNLLGMPCGSSCS